MVVCRNSNERYGKPKGWGIETKEFTICNIIGIFMWYITLSTVKQCGQTDLKMDFEKLLGMGQAKNLQGTDLWAFVKD